jgi:hypothetical protein
VREEHAPAIADEVVEVDRAHAGLGAEVGDAIADADVALLLELFVGLGEDLVRPQVLELERALRRLVDVWQQRLVLVVESLTVRFLTEPAKTKLPSAPRTSGRSKRNELLSRKSSSAGVLARCSTLLRWGKRPKRWMTATCR